MKKMKIVLQYPNTKESLKIPNLKEWVEKNLTDSVTSIRKMIVPNNYKDNSETNLSDGLIINPLSKGINKLGFRGNNVVMNLKAKDETNSEFMMAFEGENNESSFFTVSSNKKFNIDYDIIKRNLLDADRKMKFGIQNEYHSNDKILESYKGSVPIIELDGGILSLPYGISLTSKDSNHTIRKEYNDVVHNSKRGISFYFGENYFDNEIYKNNIKFNDSSLDINGKQILILNHNNGDTRSEPILQNLILSDNYFTDNILDNNNLRNNQFESLRWFGNNGKMDICNKNNPYLSIYGNNNTSTTVKSDGLMVTDNSNVKISLNSGKAFIFNIHMLDDRNYFNSSSYFTGETSINGDFNVSNTNSFFKGKVNIDNDLYVSDSLYGNGGYFSNISVDTNLTSLNAKITKTLTVLGLGYFGELGVIGSFLSDSSSSSNESGNPDTTIISDIIEVSNTKSSFNSENEMNINSPIIKINYDKNSGDEIKSDLEITDETISISKNHIRIESDEFVISDELIRISKNHIKIVSDDITNSSALYIDSDGYITTTAP